MVNNRNPVPRTFTPSRIPVRVVGLQQGKFQDSYHRLLTLSWTRFLLLWVAIYLLVNLLFAVLYWIQPGGISGARPWSFEDAFFFSVETLGTIGYGALAPHSTFANLLMTVEAFCSMALTAVGTGLIFARVSRPTARVMFSQVAVVTQREGKPTLMMRAANVRVNQILEAEVTVTLARTSATQEGVIYRTFTTLQPVRARSPLFALTWMIMHTIDEASPLWGYDHQQMLADDAELLVVIAGVDETFAQRIHARHSYLPDEIMWGRSFADVLSRDETGGRTIDYSRFHDLIPAELIDSQPSAAPSVLPELVPTA